MKKQLLTFIFIFTTFLTAKAQEENPDMNAKISSFGPMLIVNEMERSMRFYQDVLGFELVSRIPEDMEIPFRAWYKKGETTLLIQHREGVTPDQELISGIEPGGGCVMYLMVESLEYYFQRITQAEITFTPPVETEYRTLEFSFRDPEGYLVIIGQQK